MLPYDLDSTSELKKVSEQNEENMQKNLENMTKFGQETSNFELNAETQKQNDKKIEQKQGSKTIAKPETDTIKNN